MALAALTLSFLAAACTESAQNDAPIIDYVDAPAAVSAVDGAYTIPVSIGFHDNNSEVVTHVRYRSGTSVDAIVEIRSPLPTRQSADVTLVLPAKMPASAVVEITIIDGRGAESLPLPRTIALK